MIVRRYREIYCDIYIYIYQSIRDDDGMLKQYNVVCLPHEIDSDVVADTVKKMIVRRYREIYCNIYWRFPNPLHKTF